MEKRNIVIVGAGLSGLYAARLLKKTFPDVLIVEGQDRVGGRIMALDGVCPWPVQAGAEFVHGKHPILDGVFAEMGVTFSEKGWPDWWYFGKEDKLVRDDDVDEEVEKVHTLFGDCENEPTPPPGRDVSALEWMQKKGCSSKQIAVAEACYANDFCCSLRQLGLRESIEENKRWDAGEQYLLPDRSMTAITEHLSRDLEIRTGWPVGKIQYDREGAVLTSADGARQLRCDKVIVTVSLRCLQDGLIRFEPALPAWKQAAVSRLRMGNAVKLVLTFHERFWPKDMYDVVCTDAFVPEFWMLRPPRETDPGVGSPHCAVGFMAGESADAVSAMDPREAVRKFLDQLDRIFGTAENPRPASGSLHASRVFDWSREPFVRGAYTFPTLGAEPHDREALAAPVADAVFFAGEATNAEINPCMQGALDTGRRAAAEVLRSLQWRTDAGALASKL